MKYFIVLFNLMRFLTFGQCDDDNNSVVFFIMRHGDRADQKDKNWIKNCFNPDDGKFIPIKGFLTSVPDRKGSPMSFNEDTPLTDWGVENAKSTGEAFARKGIKLDYVFSSPSLRSVQTAAAVLQGANSETKIMVEPMLFENMIYYKNVDFTWMTDEELAACFPLTSEIVEGTPYRRAATREEILNLRGKETISRYYVRMNEAAKHIMGKVQKHGGGTVLIVAHNTSLDAFSRLMTTNRIRSDESYWKIAKDEIVPYCSVVKMVKDVNSNLWKLEDASLPKIKFGVEEHQFNFNKLLTD